MPTVPGCPQRFTPLRVRSCKRHQHPVTAAITYKEGFSITVPACIPANTPNKRKNTENKDKKNDYGGT